MEGSAVGTGIFRWVGIECLGLPSQELVFCDGLTFGTLKSNVYFLLVLICSSTSHAYGHVRLVACSPAFKFPRICRRESIDPVTEI